MCAKNRGIGIKASTPMSILVKIVERLDAQNKGVDLNDLFNIVYKLAKEKRIYLYNFHKDYEGNITSTDFWEDMERMISWGYAEKASEGIRLTKDGKEFASWLSMEDPLKDQFKE